MAAAREHAQLSRPELARRLGVRTSTVYRWEKSGTRPEHAAVIARLAEATGVDLDEALAAAGLRPADAPPERPAHQELPVDPDVQTVMNRLRDPEVSEQQKHLIRAQLRYLADLADRTEAPG